MSRYTENLQILLDSMYLCSRDYEVEECNSLMLIAALMDIDAFSAALEEASELDSVAIEECFDIIVEHAEFMDPAEVEKFKNHMNTELQKKNLYADDFLIYSLDLSRILEKASNNGKKALVTVNDVVNALMDNPSNDAKDFFDGIQLDVAKFRETFDKAFVDDSQLNVSALPYELSGFVSILNDKFADNPDSGVLARDKELEQIWKTIMKKTKRNIILTGEPGVGKSSIVYKLTCDIMNGTCPEQFKGFKVLSLDVSGLIAGTMYRGQAEERYKYLISFLEANKNVILFIDEIHMIVGAGGTSAAEEVNFSNALKPILAGDDVIVIGATTEDEYNAAFGKDAALRRRFRKLTIKEPKSTEVYPMLKNSIKRLEEFHGVKISKNMVEFIIFASACFNYQTKNPDRTKDLIDMSMVTAKLAGKKHVDKTSVMKNFDVNIKQFEKMSYEVKKATAYHEMGHYLMSRLATHPSNYEPIAVSIIPTENYLGVTVYDETDITPSANFDYHIDAIAADLAGRVAEELYTSETTSGASSDLAAATKRAYEMVTKYGLAKDYNRIFVTDNQYIMHSEKTIEMINEEVDNIIAKAHLRASTLLRCNRPILDELVENIMEKGMMSKPELEEIVQKHLKTKVKA